MVAATATTNGKFLRDTQAGQGFSRIDYLSFGTSNFIGVNSRLAGDGGQQLQKIEGAALGRKQGARIGADFAEHLVGRDEVAIVGMPDNFRCRVESRYTAVEPGAAAEYAGFARNDRGPRDAVTGNQTGGQVAGTDILGKGGIHVAGNFGGERVSEFDGHGGGQ